MIKLSNNKNPENPSRKRGDLRSPVRAASVKLDVSALTPSSLRHPGFLRTVTLPGRKTPLRWKTPCGWHQVFSVFLASISRGMQCLCVGGDEWQNLVYGRQHQRRTESDSSEMDERVFPVFLENHIRVIQAICVQKIWSFDYPIFRLSKKRVRFFLHLAGWRKEKIFSFEQNTFSCNTAHICHTSHVKF